MVRFEKQLSDSYAGDPSRHIAFRFRMLPVLAIIITVIAAVLLLSGCGGDVSTTPDAASPGPASTGDTSGSATLAWIAPTTYVDGTPLTTLEGFKVYYGKTPNLSSYVTLGNVNSYQVNGLSKGTTYYFAVTAYDTDGIESNYSAVVSKLIL